MLGFWDDTYHLYDNIVTKVQYMYTKPEGGGGRGGVGWYRYAVALSHWNL